MKRYLFTILVVFTTMLCLTTVASAESNDVDWDGKVVDNIIINEKLIVEKLEDGRIKPVDTKLLDNLNESDLNRIMIFMGHNNFQDIQKLTKIDIISVGGKGVESDVNNLIIRDYDATGNLVSEQVRDLNQTNTPKSIMLLAEEPSSTTYNFPFPYHNSYFKGNLAISYLGKSGRDHLYRFYYNYDWPSGSPFGWTDRVGLAWSASGVKKAGSDTGYHMVYIDSYIGWHQDNLTLNKSNIYGTVMNVPMYNASKQYGKQRVDVYYKDSLTGYREIIQGNYAHNSQSLFNGISIGPASIDISLAYREFILERNFVVGK